MPIPEYNEIKAPALQFFADRKPHKVSEIYEVLAGHFKLTEEELNDTATEYAKDVHQKVSLIDGERLADLMIEHNIGVAPLHSYELKHIDSDYFDQD